MDHPRPILRILLWCSVVLLSSSSLPAQDNLVANPGFEALADNGFFADWANGEFGKVGKTLFVEKEGAPNGKLCLRMVGTPTTWTTCAGKNIPVKPDTTYWITWRFKARQPSSSRTYLFLQTNLAQRVFHHTDRVGDVDWTFNIAKYYTRPGETSLHPVLTMQTSTDPPGTAWWDDVGVWQKLPPDLEAVYRKDHPWDDVTVSTARRLAQTDGCVVWCDRPEARIYPNHPIPSDLPAAEAISLVAPGGGHDVCQLIVTPTREMEPVSLRFSQATGPGEMPASSLSYRVLRCVPVKEVRDKSFPLGPTPDPLMEPAAPEPVRPGEGAIFWIEWAPPPGGKAGEYTAQVSVLSGGKPVAAVPLSLRCWGFDLPEVSHYRSMVLFSTSSIKRFYPSLPEDEANGLAWDILSRHRLSGFNLAAWPKPTLKDGRLELDWTRFDKVLDAAKRYRATAITLGPMFGGGCSEGWKPRFKFVGFTPLADAGFDAVYADFNRLMAERVRQAGLLDKAYVYPYDEPEPDYMDKIALLCDLIHQGAPDLKCLMTVNPAAATPLWGKVKAWISPYSVRPDVLEGRSAAGDEVWIYNMIAAIESPPLDHRLFMWRALRVRAEGGLLWNCCWWNKINPWENPTAAAVPTGRKGEYLYGYQAGQASLFYPDPAEKGPLVPALRLVLIRQGVEDFDVFSELVAAWGRNLSRLSDKAKKEDAIAKARAAFIVPIMLDATTTTTCPARAEAVRRIIGGELEVAGQGPFVIAWPTRATGRTAVTGYAELGARLTLNDKPVPLDAHGGFTVPIGDEELAAGLRWSAQKDSASKTWQWAPLQ
jgi:hypothetical protein